MFGRCSFILFMSSECSPKQRRLLDRPNSFDDFQRAQQHYKSDQLTHNFINMSQLQTNKIRTDQFEASEYNKYIETNNRRNQSDSSERNKMNAKFYKPILDSSYGFLDPERLQQGSQVHLYPPNETGRLSTLVRRVCARPPKINHSYNVIFKTLLCHQRDPVIKWPSIVPWYYWITILWNIRTRTSVLTAFLKR